MKDNKKILIECPFCLNKEKVEVCKRRKIDGHHTQLLCFCNHCYEEFFVMETIKKG